MRACFLAMLSLVSASFSSAQLPYTKEQVIVYAKSIDVQLLDPSLPSQRLEDWLQNELQIRFEGRVLNVDSAVADLSGRILAQSEALGHPMEAMDAFIAATAQVHRLMLVTRNTSDFEPVLHSVVNPWRPN